MKEQQLIFLISQPRSGSTLTQRLLGAHSKIYTRSEPWIMLNPAYTLKKEGIKAEYDVELSNRALEDFCSGLSDGKKTYLAEINKMYLNLYSDYICDTEYKYFLDKTPRYYFIVKELLQIFPNSKYILLIRNPLAVLGSIINSWLKIDWRQLSKFKYDLVDAIDVYIDIIDNYGGSFFIFNYEDLLQNDDKILSDIFNYLNIENEDVSNKYYKNKEKWQYGDQINIYKEKGIKKDNDKKWQDNLNDEQYWRVMYDYLQYIGKEKLGKIGYNFDELKKILDSKNPGNLKEVINNTKSLEFLLKDFDDIIKVQQKNRSLSNALSTTKSQLNTTKSQLNTTKSQLNTTKSELNTTKSELNAIRQELRIVYNSKIFKVGDLFFKSIKKPYKLITFPFNLIQILIENKN